MAPTITPTTSMASPEPSDVYNQTLSFVDTDGQMLNTTMAAVNEFTLYNTRILINYGCQLGATIVFLVVVCLLTRQEKRRTKSFFLYVAALTTCLIRNVLQCQYFVGPYVDFYSYFSRDFSGIGKMDDSYAILANVFTTLTLILIETVFVMQTKTLCANLIYDFLKRIVMIISVLLALLAVGFRFALSVVNNISIVSRADDPDLQWIGSGTNITATVSISWFSAVLIIKLVRFIIHRRAMHLPVPSYARVLFILTTHTMIIPVLFAGLQYTTSIPDMGSNVLTVTTIFLPLSGIWASFSMTDRAVPDLNPFGNQADSGRPKPAAYDSTNYYASGALHQGSSEASNSRLHRPATEGDEGIYFRDLNPAPRRGRSVRDPDTFLTNVTFGSSDTDGQDRSTVAESSTVESDNKTGVVTVRHSVDVSSEHA
ncbi:MAG: hypothetical protein M1817_006012 [Caeruleum heppii]|nr:MAG: hypothetical protein M1817_006012 [Caeruleum heppii]